MKLGEVGGHAQGHPSDRGEKPGYELCDSNVNNTCAFEKGNPQGPRGRRLIWVLLSHRVCPATKNYLITLRVISVSVNVFLF